MNFYKLIDETFIFLELEWSYLCSLNAEKQGNIVSVLAN